MRLALEKHHERLGATMRATGGEPLPVHYGDPAAENRAVRGRAGLADLSHRAVWRLEGPDAPRFLQGSLSNDIEALQPGQGCYALSLTNRGKVITDLVVFRRKLDFLMHAPTETRSAGFASLERFLVGDDATLTDLTGRMGMLGVYGPEARGIVASLWKEALPALPDHHFIERFFGGDTLLVSAAAWTGELGFEIIAPVALLPALWEDLLSRVRAHGGLPVGEAALDSLRLEAGTPRSGIDFDEETIPQMAGLDHALCHTKGCYRGQEIVLRVQTKGQVKRSLIGLSLEGPADSLPGRGTKLLVAGREEGWITSAIASPTLGRPLALGYLNRQVKAPGTVVEIAASPPRQATVTPLPFYRRP